MIRSTKTSLKFANTKKLTQLQSFIDEYRNVVSKFVDLLWDIEKIPNLLPKAITSQIGTWLSARTIQCAGKQASGIVRGTQKKQKSRAWMIEKFTTEGKLKKARKLQRIYDEVSITKPDISKVNPELDSRFVKIDLDNETSFDGWITLASLGDRLKLVLPFKRTKHFNKMLEKGSVKTGARISKDSITFMFELPDVPSKPKGEVLGIDIGQTTMLSCSNGITSTTDNHGHDLSSIATVMSRKKHGSLAFERCRRQRTNYINWSVNRLNLSGINQVNLEGIKDLRRGKRTSRRLSYWVYTDIFGKLKSHCSEQGVLVRKVSSAYTSQRCSQCGWTRGSNRNGKSFKCGECGFVLDSDLNASRNIALPLLGITKQQRLRQINRTGFYWVAEGQECIVPAVYGISFN